MAEKSRSIVHMMKIRGNSQWMELVLSSAETNFTEIFRLLLQKAIITGATRKYSLSRSYGFLPHSNISNISFILVVIARKWHTQLVSSGKRGKHHTEKWFQFSNIFFPSSPTIQISIHIEWMRNFIHFASSLALCNAFTSFSCLYEDKFWRNISLSCAQWSRSRGNIGNFVSVGHVAFLSFSFDHFIAE